MTRFTLYLLVVLVSLTCIADDSGTLRAIQEVGHVFNRGDVRKELEVVDDQSQIFSDLAIGYKRRVNDLESELKRIPPQEFVERAQEFRSQMNRDYEAKRQEVLLPFQLRRLDEVTWQYRSLNDPVAAFELAVNLTDEQETRMREREAELGEELLETMQNFKKRAEREILEILTPEQRKEWIKKVGTEFEFEPSQRGLSALNRLH